MEDDPIFKLKRLFICINSIAGPGPFKYMNPQLDISTDPLSYQKEFTQKSIHPWLVSPLIVD